METKQQKYTEIDCIHSNMEFMGFLFKKSFFINDFTNFLNSTCI